MGDHPVGQGHGVAGHFAGLFGPYADPTDSKVVIFPVPFDMTTTYQKGAEKGPAALIEASRNLELYDIETGFEVYHQGIHTLPAIEYKDSENMLDSVYLQTLDLLKQGKFVVTLGGEHSISSAPIRAHAEHFKSISVLQLDAHGDLPDTYEGDPLSHACVMARVLEIPCVNSVTAVGIRSMSVQELENQKRVRTFFSHDLFESDDWMDDVVDSLSERVYITLDLDVFDSSIMPSTGTPEPGGLFWHQVTKLLKKVIQKRDLIGCDVVELLPNPFNLAPDFLAAKLVYKILSYKFKYNS
jgi:agmatinase